MEAILEFLCTWSYAPTLIWMLALILFLVVEAITVGLVCIWFAGGALAAIIVALLGGQVWLQVAVFLVVSVALLASLRPLTRRFIYDKQARTNADRILGQDALVTETIDNIRGTGAIRVNGLEWTARACDREVIEKGTLVRVTQLEGVKALVVPAQQPAER